MINLPGKVLIFMAWIHAHIRKYETGMALEKIAKIHSRKGGTREKEFARWIKEEVIQLARCLLKFSLLNMNFRQLLTRFELLWLQNNMPFSRLETYWRPTASKPQKKNFSFSPQGDGTNPLIAFCQELLQSWGHTFNLDFPVVGQMKSKSITLGQDWILCQTKAEAKCNYTTDHLEGSHLSQRKPTLYPKLPYKQYCLQSHLPCWFMDISTL